MSIPKDWKVVRGYGFFVREELKELGARWDRDTGAWYCPPDKLRECEALMEESKSRR